VTKSRFPVFSFLFLIYFVLGGTEFVLGAHFTQGVKAKGLGSTQINQAFIPIDAKVEISPKGLYAGSQGQGSTQINQAFLLMQKLKLAPKDFTLGVKAKAKAQLKSSKHSYWCKC
jgi:hypothetical protein